MCGPPTAIAPFLITFRERREYHRAICCVNPGETPAHLIGRNIEPGGRDPVRPQPFVRAMLDLHGKIESFCNMISRLNSPDEGGGEDVFDSFMAKPGTRLLCLHDPVGRQVRVFPFP